MGIRDWKSWLRRDDPREEATEELVQALPGSKSAAEDFSLVDVPIEGGTLRVFLPSRFPHDKPTLQLLQPTRHEFVDRYNQVKYPGLDNWSQKTDIVRVVREVVDALRTPEVRAPAVETRPSLERPPSDRSIQAPAVPDRIDAVEAMSTKELRCLDEDGVRDLVEALPQVTVMSQMLADLRNTNLESAERVRAQREAASIKDAEAQALRMRLADDAAAYEALLARARTLEPADALAEAARAYEARARECDQTSLAVLDRWQDGTCDRPTFLEEYVEARAAHHEARVLAKLAELKRQRPPLPPRTPSYG
jgi:hypothetical protein